MSIKVNGNNRPCLKPVTAATHHRLNQSIKHIVTSTRLLIWMQERNAIKLHVQSS